MRAASPLDRPLARLIAGVCFIASAGALAYLHRDDIFPPEAAVNHALVDCISGQSARIDAILNDGLIDESKAALFRRRAAARCAAMHGGN